MYGWLDGWMNVMYGWLDGWMNVDEWIDGCLDGYLVE